MIEICDAILKINPNAKVMCLDNDINRLTWLEETTPIPKADIEAKVIELQAEYDANNIKEIEFILALEIS